MILADKIINERKKNGWSQEELADRLSVSRQSVSKWEGAQSVPDIGKILQMAELFEVSTDYLLKDEMEMEKTVESSSQKTYSPLRKVSLEEAQTYLGIRNKTVPASAMAITFLTVCPVPLIFLLGLAQLQVAGISENIAVLMGLILLFLDVALAVGVLLVCSGKVSEYKFLDEEVFETEYGVTGMVKEKKSEMKNTCVVLNAVAVIICILSPLPLITAALLGAHDGIVLCMVCVLIMMVAAAVYLFVYCGSTMESYQKLLREGDYTAEAKKTAKKLNGLEDIYWMAVTALYLVVSFWKGNWGVSWIIWPVAALLYGVVEWIAKQVIKDRM